MYKIIILILICQFLNSSSSHKPSTSLSNRNKLENIMQKVVFHFSPF